MPTTSTLLPTAVYGPGTLAFGPVAIPVGITGVTAIIDRAALVSPTLRIDWTLELSQDDGQTWEAWGGAGTIGGPPFTTSSFTVALPQPANAARKLRGSVTLTEAATTSVSITTLP